MNLTEDEIAERIVKHLRSRHGDDLDCDPFWFAADYLDEAEAYRLAFIDDVRERAKVRRQARRVRAKVFAALGVVDRKAVEK
jgi:hypothetical protein